MLFSALLGHGATLFVAPNGDDDREGDSLSPLGTIQGAVEKARGLPGSRTIRLRPGRYELTRTVELLPADSGLTLEAEGPGTAIIAGSRRLRGFVEDRQRPGLWMINNVVDIRSGAWRFHQLFWKGERLRPARSPNEGFFRAAGRLGTNSPIALPFRPGDLKAEWATNPVARVMMLMKWTDLHVPFRGFDAGKNVALLAGGPRPYWMDEPDARYWVENVPDAVDQPGEWYVDHARGDILLRLPPGENPNATPVTAPLLRTLVSVRGDGAKGQAVGGVTFRGLVFVESDYELPEAGLVSPQAAVPVRGAFRAEFATNGVVENCVFANLGGYGIDLGRGTRNWRIVGSEVRDGGAGGLRIGEPDGKDADAFAACGGHEISDNHLHRLGRVFAPAVGLIVFHAGDNWIAHNEINDLYYTAISVGWNWGYQETPCRGNVIEFNHLHHVGQGRLSDMGGVYTLGIQPGTIIRNNVIHDVVSYGYGGWGLYTDEGSTGIVLEDNVVYRCKSAGFHQHYGRENVIRNNVFALNTESQLMRTRDENHVSFVFTNNIVYFASGQLLASSWKNDRFVIDRNVYFDARPDAKPGDLRFSGATFDQWRARGHDRESVIADPLFVDPAKDDFALKPGSPALLRGFRPIRTSAVGPRKTEAPTRRK